MFQVPQVPAVAQNFNPLAPPPPPRPRCERLLYVEPVHPQVPSLMFGQIHQQMNRPAARPEREAFQNPPPGFGFSAPIISANYRFNASRCSWCKLTFGVLPFETLALHDDRADVCKLCLVRTQMTVERIFRRIEFDERANHFGSILCFSERATVLGYTNDMVQCNHCPKEVPRLELVRHVLDFHHGGAFYRCPHNCENFFRSDQMVQHSEQCVRQCVICVANGNLKAAAPQNLVHHIKAVHWQYAVCGITGCNSAYKDPGRMFNHMVENHVWRSVV
ncbi:Hypothetical predicted protein [Cloeon dipterum]|nr:Hypothetical predicted protein [Cloeon dipterum]